MSDRPSKEEHERFERRLHQEFSAGVLTERKRWEEVTGALAEYFDAVESFNGEGDMSAKVAHLNSIMPRVKAARAAIKGGAS